MLKRTLILLTLILAQAGCGAEYGEGLSPFVVDKLSDVLRQSIERDKRELLQIEDLKVGDGPIAAWGRRLSADIEVRYADGSLVYRGLAFAYDGMIGSAWIHLDIKDGMLSWEQQGIILGLNGMAVGGKRRMIIAPNLVCKGVAIGQSTPEGGSCTLVQQHLRETQKDGGIIKVRKEKLLVEAKLTASCIPGFSVYGFLGTKEVRCRDSNLPQRDPAAPIWRFYYAEPSRP